MKRPDFAWRLALKPSLIITADDFGMSPEVNEAVEEAHRRGVLTCASLVIAGDAAEDALRRARRMPNLGVGLHLAIVAAPNAAPAKDIPDLMAKDGSGLGFSPALTGARLAVSKPLLRQARAEMLAQFEAFRRSGLSLDHVDGHWHVHQQPPLVSLICEMARAFEVRAARFPREPVFVAWRAAGRIDLTSRLSDAMMHRPILWWMRSRLRRAGIGANDWFFGKSDGGSLTLERLLNIVQSLPPGISEIGLHPAVGPWGGPHAPPRDWRSREEFEALLDPRLSEAVHRCANLGTFAQLLEQRSG